ncbi:uncharacterized protein LAESUDRAFT_641687 [Laetiporus sulphureus 93-53]|uniref:Borealin N-terminal domain-containing protein n=1 Tax=Laetiporus sulphureus 93-53 TaxID=1314785 RepID=A0A165HLJ0_9APHY|nr:uncharacterized protein LAESUDRAFT_641687 [Laetiporus sulphureus 93-53]KZT11888.1 hypothetical protein LAESUDRAFT_641687 [Laetiporus sulphureus 93-53]
MLASPSTRCYTSEEKAQLLANLDLEVEHRTRQIEEWLVDTLENFCLHQESQISRIPRIVRGVTLKEFAKHGGDIQECVKGLKRELLSAEESVIDKSPRKRKWVASQDGAEKAEGSGTAGSSSRDAESSRGIKSARMLVSTPSKKKPGLPNGLGSAQRPRFPLPRTPGTTRTPQRIPSSHLASPSPHKPPAFKFSLHTRPPSRPNSPTKPSSPSKPLRTTHTAHTSRPVRPPSSAVFNPSLPPQPRWPRQGEKMLSVNGSPLANPFQHGLSGYLRSVAQGDGDDDSGGSENDLPHRLRAGKLKKKSSIIVRSSSSSLTASSSNDSHSRASSQTSVQMQMNGARSRTNSQTNGFVPVRTNGGQTDLPGKESAAHSALISLAAFVSVPTKDGHILEFDPLRTAPEEIDALTGISDDAKQQAKEDMARMIQTAVERWKIS